MYIIYIKCTAQPFNIIDMNKKNYRHGLKQLMESNQISLRLVGEEVQSKTVTLALTKKGHVWTIK